MALSRLLSLPAEIRCLIFEFALTSEKTVVTFRLDQYQRDSYSQAMQPPLTRVSRQIRYETIPLWYDCNDFVLHTEFPKVENALRWLRCNSAYLMDLRRISLWLRYVPFTNNRATSQGAIRVSLSRPKKNDWWVVEDDWGWVTVVRKPAELKGDVKFILEKLREKDMTVGISKETATPADYHSLMTDLRLLYIQEKMS